MKIFLILLLLVGFGCEKVKENNPMTALPAPGQEKQVTLPESAPGAISVANVVISPQGKQPITLTVEVARTPAERSRGLQNRDSLPQDHGMWFVFEEDNQEPFWMKDTLIPLDLLFIGADGTVVDFVENAVPNSEVLIVSRKPYRTVLEVNAGLTHRWGVALGDRVEFRAGPPG